MKIIDINHSFFDSKKSYFILFNRAIHKETVWRENKNGTGRMGGGWKWKAGILIGPSCWVLEFFVVSFRVTKLYSDRNWRQKLYAKLTYRQYLAACRASAERKYRGAK